MPTAITNLPHEFKAGPYRLMVGHGTDKYDQPTKEKFCWLWNAHYWELLFPVEQAEIDEESLIHTALLHLRK